MATAMPNLQADFMNRYTSEIPPMPGLMGGLAGEDGGGRGGRTGGIGLVQNRSASQWGGLNGAPSQYQPNSGAGGGLATQAEINPMDFNAGVGGGLSGPGSTGDLAGDLDAGIPGHHSAAEYGGVIGAAHSLGQKGLGFAVNNDVVGPIAQAAMHAQQKDFDETDIDKPSTISAMGLGFGPFGGFMPGFVGLALSLADRVASALGFGLDPAIAGEDLGGYGLGDAFGGIAGVAGVSGFGSEGGSYGEGYGGGYGGVGGLSGDMGGFGEGSIGSGNSQGAGDEGDGGSTW